MKMNEFKFRRGQIAIVAVIVSVLFILLMFPVFDMFMKNESKWSVKEKKDTAAFHLAEAGVDRAKWKLMETSDMWYVVSSGPIAGYDFDKVYTDVGGGSYTIRISSDPSDSERRIVESVGRDATNNEIRRIKVVLQNSNSADFATRAVNLVSNTGGNDHIEWGPVISGNSIDISKGGGGVRKFPRYYSAGHVSPVDGGSTTSSSDDIYWWSYYDIPPLPDIKFSYYLDSATASGTTPGSAPNGCGNGNSSSYYFVGDATFKGCQDTSNKTYYINGKATFKDGSGGNFIRGTMIIIKDIEISGNGGGKGSYQAHLPAEAWKEYAKDWGHYLVFDPDAPSSYDEAVSENYLATNHTYPLSNVLVHGFVYTGGSQGLQGGGNGNIHGALMSAHNATMGTSTMAIYYDDEVTAALQIQGVKIKQVSWYEVKGEWPNP